MMKSKILSLILIFFGALSLQGQIVINEVNYRSEVVQEKIEFIELHNPTGAAVNISGWHFVDAVHYKFPAGTSIPAGGYVVVAQDPADVQARFGITGVLGPWIGKLSNEGDNIELRDGGYAVVDKVDYVSWDEWPSVRWQDFETTGLDGDGKTIYINNKVAISIQKRHPDLLGRHGGSWTSDNPTPKAANAIASNWALNPIISKVSKSPNSPSSSDAVIIKAEIEAANINPTVVLQYQIVNAGSYIKKSDAAYSNWTNVTMNDSGNNGDAAAGDGEYTATLPASVQVHRRLVRYRISVTSGSFNEIYPDQNHNESNYAYYVYDSYPSVGGINLNSLDELQDIQLLTSTSEMNDYLLAYDLNNYPGQGTIVYNGEVYDHIGFRARGKGSRHKRLKRNVKFDLNSEHQIPVLDDCGDEYNEARGKLTLSGTWVNDADSHGLTESLVYKIAELNGGFNKLADYVHFRIVDGTSEGGTNGDFYGVYLILEDWGGDMISEHKLPDGNVYTYKGWLLANEGENGPYGANNTAYTDWNDAMGNSQDGCSSLTNPLCTLTIQNEAFYRNNLDLDYYFADWSLNEIVSNGETNYNGQHSYREYYNPETQKWIIQCGDYDENFGFSHSNKVVRDKFDPISGFGSIPSRIVRGPVKAALLTYPALEIDFVNELRSTIDLLFNQEQKDFLIDSESKLIFDPSNGVNWTDVDYAKWNNQLDFWSYDMDYNDYNTEVVQWYRDWFDDRNDYLLNGEFADTAIPNTPTISLTGTPAIDNLTFSNSAFSDPNGNGTFAALEWRVGEWSDPANSFYASKCEEKYEITPVFESGEISSFSSSYTIPSAAQLEADKTYKVRVRYKDTSGRFSHWSDAVDFKAIPALNPPAYNLVINEIMYNPSEECGVEYLELYNNGNSTISLDDVYFEQGIKHKFPTGSVMPANSYIVLAEDSIAFTYKYGFSPDGDYGGSLSNSGELIEIRGKFNTLIDAVTYDDSAPWSADPDGNGPSLSLKDPNLDNSLASSWKGGIDNCGSPNAVNNVCYVLSISSTSTNPLCFGTNDGTASVSISSSSPGPYVVSWSHGPIGTSVTNLVPGNYIVTITDQATDCSEQRTINIGSPPPALTVSTSKTNILCAGANTGVANASASGGALGYSYSWSNGASGATATGLSPGSYTVTVTDANNCTKTGTVNITSPSTVVVSTSATDPLCPGVNDGVATASASGGAGGYSYSWSNGASGATATGLPPGSYTVTVTDGNSCVKTQSVTVNPPNNVLSASSVDVNPTVFGAGNGTITLSTTGPNVTSYSWDNGASTQNLTGLSAGNYTVTMVDVNGCTSTYTTSISPGPQYPVAGATFTPNNGVAPINISFNAGSSSDPDGTIVSYSWDFGDGSSGSGLNPTHNYTADGTYTVVLTITDSDGLTDTVTLTVTVISPCNPPTSLTLISATANGLIVSWVGDPDAVNYNLRYRDASVGGGWTDYTTSGTTAIITGLNSCTDYEVKVSNQCTFNLTSGYSTTQIMTTTNCFVCTAPAGLYQFNIQSFSTIITWDVLVGVSSYTYKFRKVGDATWNSVNTPFPIAVLFSISPCTDYEWTMETTCYDGSTAQSGTINNFTTACKGELDSETSNFIDLADITVYPNPAADIINVVVPELIENETMHIFNAQGQIMITESNFNSSQVRLDVSEWTSGMYIIKYGRHEETFIKL